MNKKLLHLFALVALLSSSCKELSILTLIGTYHGSIVWSNCPEGLDGGGDYSPVKVIITEYSDEFIEVQLNNGSPKRAKLKDNDIYYGFDFVNQIYTENGIETELSGSGSYSSEGLSISAIYESDNFKCTTRLTAIKDE